jgi:outer membrane protein OmpA-like peptidoglycan-associated protein
MRLSIWLVLSAIGCAKDAPILAPVNFESGTTTYVNDADAAAVEEAAEVLRTTKWAVIVLGLADTEGDPASNQKLSVARAEAVAEQLREKTDVDDARIRVHGFGERLAVGESVRERKVEFVFHDADDDRPLKEIVDESGVLDPDIRRKQKAVQDARAAKRNG